MPYISPEKVREIRVAIRKTFPEFKFSVTCQHYMSVHIEVLSGPIDFGETYQQINHFWIAENWKENPKAKKFLLALDKIATSAFDGGGFMDSDYGYVPDYYHNINIGRWDKPYVIKK
jgi:hypothetical protein